MGTDRHGIAMNAITAARRLTETVRHATGIDLPPVDDTVFLEPHGLRHLLETALAGTAGRVRVAGTLDRRLVFLEDRGGRWVVADLSGQPHRTWAEP